MKVGDTTFKVHLDGYNLLPLLTGQTDGESAQGSFFYFNDDSDLVALRYDNWKIVFVEQRGPGHDADLGQPFTDPARAEDLQSAHRPLRAGGHHVEHLLRLVAQPRVYVRPGAGHRWQFLATFKEFPQRQKAGSFSLDEVLEKLREGATGQQLRPESAQPGIADCEAHRACT